MSSFAGTPADQLQAVIAAVQKTPFEGVGAALEAQLKAIDDWEATVRENPALLASAQVARAQLQAQIGRGQVGHFVASGWDVVGSGPATDSAVPGLAAISSSSAITTGSCGTVRSRPAICS